MSRYSEGTFAQQECAQEMPTIQPGPSNQRSFTPTAVAAWCTAKTSWEYGCGAQGRGNLAPPFYWALSRVFPERNKGFHRCSAALRNFNHFTWQHMEQLWEPAVLHPLCLFQPWHLVILACLLSKRCKARNENAGSWITCRQMAHIGQQTEVGNSAERIGVGEKMRASKRGKNQPNMELSFAELSFSFFVFVFVL